MEKFKVTWVGDKTYEKDGVKEYSIAVKTQGGEEIRKGLKIRRPSDAPAPAVDEILSGVKAQHPKFSDASMIQEDAAGAVGEASNGSAPVAASDAERTASIEAQAVAKGCGSAATSPEDFAARIKAGYAAIQELKAAGGTPTQAPATEQQETQPSTDDDIPF